MGFIRPKKHPKTLCLGIIVFILFILSVVVFYLCSCSIYPIPTVYIYIYIYILAISVGDIVAITGEHDFRDPDADETETAGASANRELHRVNQQRSQIPKEPAKQVHQHETRGAEDLF